MSRTDTLLINEIFCSIQGEGHFTGIPSVFIRTSGCNLRCPFCDTQHQQGTPTSVADIVDRAQSYAPRHAVLTGGEPSLQPALPQLVDALHKAGFFVQVETNGTRPLPPTIDWVTCSPKFSEQLAPSAESLPVVITNPHELKVVFMGQDLTACELMFHPQVWSLQPCDMGEGKRNRELLEATVEYVLSHPHWRLSLQTHKLIGVR